MVARFVRDEEAAGSNPVISTKNPSTLSADFLFKPIGLVYHHTIGVHVSIGLMRYSGFATDDMQN